MVWKSRNWYTAYNPAHETEVADSEFDDPNYDPDNSYITTALCAPGYCCNEDACQFPNRFIIQKRMIWKMIIMKNVNKI